MNNMSTSAPPDNSASEAPSCASCDTARSAGAKFCPQCGRDLTTPPAAVNQLACVVNECPPLGGVGSSGSTSVEAQQPPRCACGRPLPDDASYCPGCGVALGVQPDSGIWLKRVGSQGKDGVIPLVGEQLIIGKDSDCDVVIADDSYVSRRHARLRKEDNLIFLDDLGSS
ncbi:MAG: zinc ribbon domain-containing protein, partial [Planctomycetes bacterium]|nr:zinc ribbon domain-containing protein [Planctomycetota bacterium]